jgi:uncharacterized protein YodC (DUF2158 family)
MDDEIKPRSIVKVRSGGPKMTVTKVAKDSLGTLRVWCTWFDTANKPQEDSFPIEALEIYEAPTQPPTVRRFNPGGDY